MNSLMKQKLHIRIIFSFHMNVLLLFERAAFTVLFLFQIEIMEYPLETNIRIFSDGPALVTTGGTLLLLFGKVTRSSKSIVPSLLVTTVRYGLADNPTRQTITSSYKNTLNIRSV